MKKKDRQHISKKDKKIRKENKAIQSEMREAEAEVDAEERSSHVSRSLSAVTLAMFLILTKPCLLTAHGDAQAAVRAVL